MLVDKMVVTADKQHLLQDTSHPLHHTSLLLVMEATKAKKVIHETMVKARGQNENSQFFLCQH